MRQRNGGVWLVVFVASFVAAFAAMSVIADVTGLNDAPLLVQIPVGAAVPAVAVWAANRIARLPRFNRTEES